MAKIPGGIEPTGLLSAPAGGVGASGHWMVSQGGLLLCVTLMLYGSLVPLGSPMKEVISNLKGLLI